LEQAAKNNIKVKVSLSGPQDKIKKINNKSTLKTTFTNSNSRLYISDRKEVLFMITPDKAEEEIGVWLHSPFFAEALAGMLNNSIKKEK